MQLGLPGWAFSSMIPPSLEKYETAEVLHGSHKKHERKKELRRKWKRQKERKKLVAKGLNPDESNKIKKMA